MNSSKRLTLILILGALTAIMPFSVDLYLPSFAAIAQDLHTSLADVSLSLSSFLIGVAGGQLLFGPLLDRYGRRLPLYLGLVLYLLASAGCALALSIQMLVALRFIQAIGSCAASVAAMAMVRDFFPVSENAKVFALLILVVGVVPMIAPTAGGYLTAAFGWRSLFMLLAGVAIMLAAVVCWKLPPGAKANPSFSLQPGMLVSNYVAILQQRHFFTYAIGGSVAFAGILAYVAGSPILFMEVFHVDQQTYGWIMGALSMGFIGSSQLNTLLLRRYTSQQIFSCVLSCQLLVVTMLLVGSMAGWLNLYTTILLLLAYLCSVGLIQPNTAALSLAPFSHNTGSAAALLGSLQMGLGAVASMAVSLFTHPDTTSIAAIMTTTTLTGLLLFMVGGRKRRSPVDESLDKPCRNELETAQEPGIKALDSLIVPMTTCAKE